MEQVFAVVSHKQYVTETAAVNNDAVKSESNSNPGQLMVLWGAVPAFGYINCKKEISGVLYFWVR